MPAFTNLERNSPVVVAGAGGFIGGALVDHLIEHGFADVLAVDIKPPADWYRMFPEARSVQADLSKEAECLTALRDSRYVFNLAADMGGMGFLENKQSRVHAFGADQHAYAACRPPTWDRAVLLLLVGLRLQRGETDNTRSHPP